MSKYSTDRNGVTIGWDNVFFYRDQFEEFHDFNAIVAFENLYAEKINSLNYNLESFASQLVLRDKTYVFPTAGELLHWQYRKTFRVVSPWWVKWLDDNAPGWGTPPPKVLASRESATVFFKKVGQARKFREMIAKQLVGFPPVRMSTLHGRKEKVSGA